MSVIRCLLTFKKLRQADLPIFAVGVKDGVYGNATVFPAPPIMATDFEILIANYTNKLGLLKTGGSAQRPGFEAAKTALTDGLVNTASYVDTLVNGDENIVILAGYKPSKPYSSDVAKPTKLNGATLKRDDQESGKLIAECATQNGVNAYVCIITEGAPAPSNINITSAGQLILQGDSNPLPPTSSTDGSDATNPIMAAFDFNQNRRKEFTELTPLKTYYAVFFAINAGGVGPFSDPASVVCL
jgi:hypothetical protein